MKAYGNYQNSRIQIQENKDTLVEIDNYKKLANELTQKYQTIGGDFAKIRMALPSDPEFAGIIGSLDSIARMSNVNIAGMTFREVEAAPKTEPGTADYSVVEINLAATGTYEELKTFFEETEKELRLMDVTSISFKKGSTQRGATKSVIDANVIINAYYQKIK